MKIIAILLGYGAVQKASMYMWEKLLPNVQMTTAIIIDPKEIKADEDLPEWLKPIYKHVRIGLDEKNYKKVLDDINKEYKPCIMIDLSINVDGLAMIKWCQENKILYVNTALEDWESYSSWNHRNAKIVLDDTERGKKFAADMKEHTLLYRQIKVKRKFFDKKSTTAIIESGQNPGMCNHFVKIGLVKALHSKKADNIRNIDKLRKLDLRKCSNYAKIAHGLGLRIVHIAEQDTQIPKKDVIKNYGGINKTFINTWSAAGYVEESIDPATFSYSDNFKIQGTWIEELGYVKMEHQIILPIRSMNLFCKSIIPDADKGYKPKEIIGRVISHGEASSIADFLQIKVKKGDQTKLLYRPTVHYVYDSSEISKECLKVLRKNDYVVQPNERVLNADEILKGHDTVGSLLIFSKESGLPPFYMGTIVDNEYAKKFDTRFINATTLQVVPGVLGAVEYLLKHPRDGVHFSETLPSDRFVKLGKICLGKIFCNFLNYKFKSIEFTDLAYYKYD